MVTHVLLLKLNQNEATSQRRHWVKQQANLWFNAFPQHDFTWKTPIVDDLSKWDGLILIETQTLDQTQDLLNSSQYTQWLKQIQPYLACIKGWSFTL